MNELHKKIDEENKNNEKQITILQTKINKEAEQKKHL